MPPFGLKLYLRLGIRLRQSASFAGPRPIMYLVAVFRRKTPRPMFTQRQCPDVPITPTFILNLLLNGLFALLIKMTFLIAKSGVRTL